MVREVTPELFNKGDDAKSVPYAKSQNAIAPKEYRSAHAKRQRDIKRLIDSKHGSSPVKSTNERTGGGGSALHRM